MSELTRESAWSPAIVYRLYTQFCADNEFNILLGVKGAEGASQKRSYTSEVPPYW